MKNRGFLSLLVVIAFLLLSGIVFADQDEESYGVTLTVDPSIEACVGPIQINGNGDPANIPPAHIPWNKAGYFDTNGPTQIIYSGTTPDPSTSWPDFSRQETGTGASGWDVIKTNYTISYRNPDDSVINGTSVGMPVYVWAKTLVVDGWTTQLYPHQGMARIWISLDADLEYADDAGEYDCSLTLTATVSSY